MQNSSEPKARLLNALKPLKNNPRKISSLDFENLKKSIKQNPDFFEARPLILSDRTGDLVILGGNQRYKAAKALGLKEVPTHLITGLTEEREREIIIRDNVANGEWDIEELADAWNMDDLKSWGLDEKSFKEIDAPEEYNDFIEKFQPKLTTDDCYTPVEVYETVLNFVKTRYNLDEKTQILRPFKPNGDYTKEDYTGNCIVVDNPPFSINSEILEFYKKNNVKFFLFANHLTFLNATKADFCTKVITGAQITYDNTASVSTSFYTNLEEDAEILILPELRKAIEEAQEKPEERARYHFPNNLITAARLAQFTKYGEEFKIPKSSARRVSNLDGMKKIKKGVYGGARLLSDKCANELAEKIEKAKQAQAEAKKLRDQRDRENGHFIELSAREREIINELNRAENETL